MAKAFAKILGHDHGPDHDRRHHTTVRSGEINAILKLVPGDSDHHKGFFHHLGRSDKPSLPVVTEQRYFALWKELRQPNAATGYLEAVFRKVAELEPDERKPSGESSRSRRASRRSWTYGLQYRTTEGKQVSPGCPQFIRSFRTPPQRGPFFEIGDNGMAALLNTALLLALFQDVDFSKPGIVAAIDYVPEHLESAAESWRHTVTHILKLLQTSRTKSISTILALCAAFMSSSMSASDNSLIASAWIYLWLQDHALNGRAKKLHKALFKCLEIIANDKITIVTPAHELQVLCLLFVLRQILSLVRPATPKLCFRLLACMTPVPDEPLKKLEDVVESFTFWSYPVGYHASQTLSNILIEKKSPGHAMRKRCALNDIRLSAQAARSRSASESRGRVYLLLNSQWSSRSFALQSLLDCKRAEALTPEDDANRLHFLKVLQVCQMLKWSDVPAKEAVVCKLPATTVSVLHGLLVGVEEEASRIEEVENARKHRGEKMADAWNEIMEACKSGKITAATMNWKEEVGEFTAARLLPLEFHMLRTDARWRPNPLEVQETSTVPGPMQPQYSRSTAEAAIKEALDTSPFGSKGKSLQSESITSDTVRILVGGGDGTIHYILLGYINLVAAGVLAGGRQVPNSPHTLDVIFHILPTGRRSNLLATFIAQRDLWYDAMIYRSIKSKLPLVPHISQTEHKSLTQLSDKSTACSSSSSSSLEHKSEAIPSLMLTRQIETYILEADCVLKIMVFNCEAWYRDDKGNKFFTTIPFCMRAEIGVPAVAVSTESHKKVLHHQCVPRSPESDHLDPDRLEDLVSGYSIKVRLTYKPTDWDGSERAERNIPLAMVALSAINVSKPAERRLECDPSNDLLNVCVLQADSKRRKLRAVEELMSDMCTFRTRKLVIEAGETSKAFDVLLDGEVYGPFYRIRLGTCFHPLDRDAGVRFSVATYWPTHISRRSS